MQWPPWSLFSREHWNKFSTSGKTAETSTPTSRPGSENTNLWTYYTSPSIVLPTVTLTSTILLGYRLYILYLRRVPTVNAILPNFWYKRSFFGRVTSVGDGDGFRFFHTPGGRLTGWDWLPWRKIPRGKKLKDQTISIRIAGIDAPETAHFGQPAQRGGPEAHEWLKTYIQQRRVRAYIYKRDHYDRVVARVYVWRGIIRRDVGLEMLKRGLATVYEARSGAEFGGAQTEKKYRDTEASARRQRKGIWRREGNHGWESPREFKTRVGSVKEQV